LSTEKQRISEEIFTPANVLSTIRFLLLPVFVVLLVGFHNNVAAFVVMTVAALTDLIDGQLARFTNTVSRLGTQLDPIVDRFFILFAVVSVMIIGRLPVWAGVSLVFRDALMLLISLYDRKRYRREFNVILLGKIATAALMSAFCSLVLYWPMVDGLRIVEHPWLPGLGVERAPLGYILLYTGMIFSWISALYYLQRGLQPPPDAKTGVSDQPEVVETDLSTKA
jgi:cardiolipin synthase